MPLLDQPLLTVTPVSSSITAFEIEALNRKRTMLRSAFGPVIAAALQEPQVIEVMVNPDGRLWLDRLDQGRIATEWTCHGLIPHP